MGVTNHTPVIETFGLFGLLSLDDFLPLCEDSGYSHGRLQNLDVMCSSVKREEEEGYLGCTATLCCRRRFPASGAAGENDDSAPPHLVPTSTLLWLEEAKSI